MLLYLSSNKFGQNTEFLQEWIKKHNNIIPHYKSNYHKVHLIDEIVQVCEKENIKFKAVKDGEVIIIDN